MKNQTPERVLEKLWALETVNFWHHLAMHAPTERHRNLYLAQLSSGITAHELTQVHVGQKGVTMYCPKCLEEFLHVSTVHAAYCGCTNPPTRVRPAKDIVAIDDAVQKFFLKKAMGR